MIRQLEQMLKKDSLGNILAKFADIYDEDAITARKDGDSISCRQFMQVGNTLRVMAKGIDVICRS